MIDILHAMHVSNMARNVGIHMGLTEHEVTILSVGGLFHDVGKITISDTILNKPARLTDDEYELIKRHVTEGERIIEEMIAHTGEEAFLHHALMFAGMHHEHWDGSGYPRKMKNSEIPLEGRIMAVADVYDALVSERPYKRPFTHEEAVKIIMADSGRHFDPQVAGVFAKVHERFRPVANNTIKKGV